MVVFWRVRVRAMVYSNSARHAPSLPELLMAGPGLLISPRLLIRRFAVGTLFTGKEHATAFLWGQTLKSAAVGLARHLPPQVAFPTRVSCALIFPRRGWLARRHNPMLSIRKTLFAVLICQFLSFADLPQKPNSHTQTLPLSLLLQWFFIYFSLALLQSRVWFRLAMTFSSLVFSSHPVKMLFSKCEHFFFLL